MHVKEYLETMQKIQEQRESMMLNEKKQNIDLW